MPDVSRIILGLRIGVMSDTGDEEEPSVFLVDDDDLAGVVADMSEEDFVSYRDEEMLELSRAIGDEVAVQVFDSLLSARDQLVVAVEEADAVEMFENQEPEWEI